AHPDSGIGPCQWTSGVLMAQGRRHGALLLLEHRRHRLDRGLRLAGGGFVDVGVDARVDESADRGGQRLVEHALTVVLLRTDHVEPEIHTHEPNTFRTTTFARRVTRR